METKKLMNCGSIILAGIGAIALCVGIHMTRKAKKATEKANKAIKNVEFALDDIADKTPAQVSDMIIKKAAEKAADRAAEEAVEKVRSDIDLRVCNAVTLAYDNVEEKAKEKLVKAVDRKIDLRDLKQRVENEAASRIVAKFMENLSDYAGPIVKAIINKDDYDDEDDEDEDEED